MREITDEQRGDLRAGYHTGQPIVIHGREIAMPHEVFREIEARTHIYQFESVRDLVASYDTLCHADVLPPVAIDWMLTELLPIYAAHPGENPGSDPRYALFCPFGTGVVPLIDNFTFGVLERVYIDAVRMTPHPLFDAYDLLMHDARDDPFVGSFARAAGYPRGVTDRLVAAPDEPPGTSFDMMFQAAGRLLPALPYVILKDLKKNERSDLRESAVPSRDRTPVAVRA